MGGWDTWVGCLPGREAMLLLHQGIYHTTCRDTGTSERTPTEQDKSREACQILVSPLVKDTALAFLGSMGPRGFMVACWEHTDTHVAI